jgi:hypothetical protein
MPILQMVAYPVEEKWKPWANTVAYYPLTANANDYSGNWYNATNNGGTFSTANWWYFGTDTARITLPSMTIWQTFTISCWVKFPDWQPTWNKSFELYYDRIYSYRNIIFQCSAWWFDCYTGNNWTSHNVKSVSASFWTWWNNIILSKSWTTYSIYKNWVLVETFTSPYNVSIPWWNNTIEIPHLSYNTEEYSAYGYLKDYIIENVAWSSQDVSDYYNLVKSKYWL